MASRAAAALAVWLVGLAGIARAADCAPPDTVDIPAGAFIAGSDAAERDYAYRLDEAAYGHALTRQNGWYDREAARHSDTLPGFAIMLKPVTNDDYACFVTATGHKAPDVAEREWQSYGLIHPFERTRRHAWSDGKPAEGRSRHPVVLVAYHDALAYAAWLTGTTGTSWRLPTALEWEKAARGIEGRIFPWGNTFDPKLLNSHDAGPFDTMPVGQFPDGRSSFGLFDAAGQVFEWTATPAGAGRHMVKGGSWDDKGCGVCRPAAGHGRPDGLKHILIGFRLVREARPSTTQ